MVYSPSCLVLFWWGKKHYFSPWHCSCIMPFCLLFAEKDINCWAAISTLGSMLAYALKLTLLVTEVLVLRLLRANPSEVYVLVNLLLLCWNTAGKYDMSLVLSCKANVDQTLYVCKSFCTYLLYSMASGAFHTAANSVPYLPIHVHHLFCHFHCMYWL